MSSRPPLVLGGAIVIVLLAVSAGIGGSFVGSPGTRTTVERVIDGDTLVVRGGAHVRLLQIDAPEAGEECYARSATAELVRLAGPGARLELETDPGLDRVDRYGRLLRYVHAEELNVNVELVRRGAATPWFYDGDRGRYANQLLAATASAKAARRGMWGACRVSWNPYGPVTTRPR